MPNTKSAERRVRNSARKQVRNNIVRSQLKTTEKKFRGALAAKPDDSAAALRTAISTLDKAVKKGVIKRGTADRKKSRLTLALNKALLAELQRLDREIRVALPDSTPLRVGELLHWPGMLEEDAGAGDARKQMALDLAADAVKEFTESRGREGEKLKTVMMERVSRMEALLADIQPRLPEAIASYQERMTTRLREALGSADDDRVRQEIALYGIKVDVNEELNRLGAHLSEVRRVLNKGGPAGKRLDFLMQELNREANTLGSKSVSSEVSAAAMEMKILIEQMREQVQNIE